MGSTAPQPMITNGLAWRGHKGIIAWRLSRPGVGMLPATFQPAFETITSPLGSWQIQPTLRKCCSQGANHLHSDSAVRLRRQRAGPGALAARLKRHAAGAGRAAWPVKAVLAQSGHIEAILDDVAQWPFSVTLAAWPRRWRLSAPTRCSTATWPPCAAMRRRPKAWTTWCGPRPESVIPAQVGIQCRSIWLRTGVGMTELLLLVL